MRVVILSLSKDAAWVNKFLHSGQNGEAAVRKKEGLGRQSRPKPLSLLKHS
jgi:hypothetical protein